MTTIARNTAGATIFLGVTVIALVYDIVGHYAHHEWDAKTPHFLHDMMPFMFNVGVPIFILLAGFATLGALQGDSRAFVGIVLLAAVTAIWNIFPTIWRLQAGEPYGAAICAFEIVAGALSVRYAIAAMQGLRAGEQSVATPASKV